MSALRVAGAVIALLVAAPAAHAELPATAKFSVPAGGSATVSSPELSPSMTSIGVDVVPESSADQVFNRLTLILAGASSLKQRLMTCVYLYKQTQDVFVGPEPVKVEAGPAAIDVLFLAACIEMAVQMGKPPAVASAAAAACHQLGAQVAAKFKKSGSRYTATVDGTVKKAPKKLSLRTTCTRKGAGYSLRIRPRAKGKSLRSVIGKKLTLGMKSPADAGGASKVRMTFRP